MNKLKMIVMIVTVIFSVAVLATSYNYETRDDIVLESPITLLAESYACEDIPITKSIKAPERKYDANYIQRVAVIKIIDGDTFKVIFEDGVTNNIRLARVDCAETSLRAKLFKDCYYQKVTAQFQLNMGKLVKQTVESWNITNLWIMHDSTKNIDRWSRELFWCYLTDKTNIYESLNYILLKQGLGKHSYKEIPYPTQKIKQAMDLAELEAREIEPNDDQRLYNLQDVNKLITKALKNQEQYFINQLKEIQKINTNGQNK